MGKYINDKIIENKQAEQDKDLIIADLTSQHKPSNK